MSTAASCSLTCLLSRGSSRAVIFRRGPSRQTCLIAWDRRTDTFEVGQWFRGRVYPERCDISADGEWLLVFMATHRPPLYAWTVLSRPPYFTAIALWAQNDTWGGGGLFLGAADIALNHPQAQTPTLGRAPAAFTVHPARAIEERIGRALAKNPHRWQAMSDQPRGPFQKRQGGSALRMTWSEGRRRWDYGSPLHEIVRADSAVALPGLDWADLDSNGDVLFAIGGALFRLTGDDAAHVADGAEALGAAKQLADFSGLAFRPLRAPYEAAGDPGAGHGGYMARIDGRVSKEDRRERQRRRKAEANAAASKRAGRE